MKNKTFITGRDAALEDSLTKMKAGFASIGLEIIEGPVKNPVKGCWSIKISEKETGLYTNGKGATELAARVSAYAEFYERFCTGFFFENIPFLHIGEKRDWYFSADEKSFTTLEDIFKPDLYNFYNNHGELTPEAISTPYPGDTIIGLPFLNVEKGTTGYFPVQILCSLYQSNGLAVGNNNLEARVQGLAEIIERNIKFKVIGEKTSLPDIPDEYTGLEETRKVLLSHGYELMVKDASFGGKYPVVCAALTKLSEGSVMLSFGSHPNFDVALQRTITELFQGRELDQFVDMDIPSLDGEAVSDISNLESHYINSTGLVHMDFFNKKPDVPFTKWGFSGTREEEWAYLLEIIKNEGYQVYLREYEFLGMWIIRLVVPGFSEVYPVEDLLEENPADYAAVSTILEGIGSADKHQLEDYLSLLDNLGFDYQQKGEDLLNLSFSGMKLWEESTFFELKLLLLLLQNQKHEAKELLEYGLSFFDFPKNHGSFWQLVLMVLKDGIDSVKKNVFLEKLFPKEGILGIEDLFQGKWPQSVFPDFGSALMNIPQSKTLHIAYKAFRRLWDGGK